MWRSIAGFAKILVLLCVAFIRSDHFECPKNQRTSPSGLCKCCNYRHFTSWQDAQILIKCIDGSYPVPPNPVKAVTAASESVTANDHIVFSTFVSPEIFPYARNSMLVTAHFLSKLGYSLRILSAETGDDHHPIDKRWNKILASIHAFAGWAKRYEYLVFIDADLMIIDDAFDISKHIVQNKDADIILASDSIDVANTGFMIVRNTKWSIDFLERWWGSMGMMNTFCDQHVLNNLISDVRKTDDAHRIAVIPAKLINSVFPSIENFNETDKVLHLMGETNDVRDVVSAHLAGLVCRSCAAAVSLHNLDSTLDEGTCSSTVNNGKAVSGDVSNALGVTKGVLERLKHDAMLSDWINLHQKCSMG